MSFEPELEVWRLVKDWEGIAAVICEDSVRGNAAIHGVVFLVFFFFTLSLR